MIPQEGRRQQSKFSEYAEDMSEVDVLDLAKHDAEHEMLEED